MGEILSQHEIDSLLNSMSSGQVDVEEIKTLSDPKRIRVYDFKRPNKFSKGQIQFLRNIHENFSRTLKNDLTAHLRAAITTAIRSIEQISYDEFIRSLPTPAVLGVFTLSPLEGNVLIEMSTHMSLAMIDRLLGGTGEGAKQDRELTEIEKKVIERRLAQMVGLFQEAWEEVYAVEPGLVSVETNPQFAQIAAPNEIIALVTMEVTIGETSGMINICLPYLVLEPILNKLSTYFLYATHAKVNSPEQTKAIRAKLEGVLVELTAILGETEILVKDLLDLAPGDVIPLSRGINMALPVYIGNSIRFIGTPGLYREHLAVQISEVLMEGMNDNG